MIASPYSKSDEESGARPPSVLFEEFFAQVAHEELFADAKFLADATYSETPDAVRQAFARRRPHSRAALREFVDEFFSAPTEAATTKLPAAGLSLREHIAALWPLLTRRAVPSPLHSSLLPLPHPYVVPGGRFVELYYWDSYFTMLGFAPGLIELKRGMVANFADLIRRCGHIPNGNRTYYLSRSQPPFFFKMVELIDPADPERALAAYLPELIAEHSWWMNGEPLHAGASARMVRMPDGSVLNRYWDDRDTPRDEAYRADVEAAKTSTKSQPAFCRDVRAAAESGWDFSSRWFADGRTMATIQTSAIVPIDLNCILFGLENAIARGCRLANDHAGADAFAAKVAARAAAIAKYLWNDSLGLFGDFHWEQQRLLDTVSAATLYPLFFEMATKEQAGRVAQVVERQLVHAGGIVTTNVVTGQQWDSPNGWAPLQWIAVVGLRNYGHDELARAIAQRWLTTVSDVYAKTGKMFEKYDVVSAAPGGGGEYQLQDGFGWTNGVTAALLEMYPDIPVA